MMEKLKDVLSGSNNIWMYISYMCGVIIILGCSIGWIVNCIKTGLMIKKAKKM